MKKESYTKDEILSCARGELFGPENARLPSPNMLMIDRVSNITETGGKYDKGFIDAELDINPDLWFFGCHFPNDPVMPGCLGLDAIWQLLGFYMAWTGLPGKGRALGVGEVKFTGQILPTNKLVTYHVDIHRIVKGKLGLGIADGIVCVDGERIYEANGLRVGLFTSTNF